MKVLELFAGSRSIGRAAEALGMEAFSSDINDFPGIHYQVDILQFDVTKVPFKPDIIWASPPCTTFSVASIGHHWTGGSRAYVPKTESAVIGKAIAVKTIEIIRHFTPPLLLYREPKRPTSEDGLYAGSPEAYHNVLPIRGHPDEAD